MADVFGDLVRRVEMLEAQVLGRASKHFNRKLGKPQVAQREGKSTRTIERGVEAGTFPPPDGFTNGFPWWWLSTLEANDRAQAALPPTTKKPLNAGRGRPRFRKDFTLSEAVAIKRALEPIEKAAAKERQGTRTDKHLENFSTSSHGRALDKVAAVVGKHRTTLAKAEAVVDAAAIAPERFGKLLEDMDRSGRVNGPYRRLKNIKAAEANRAEPPPLPNRGPYRAGMVDIPWAYEPDDENAAERGVLPYPTLSIEQACTLPVASILQEDCVVGMWVTNFVLSGGLHRVVLDAWGLEGKTVVTWPKDRCGRGHWAKGQTEHLVIATRGKPVVTLTNQTTLLNGPFHLVQKDAHSAKPVEAYTYFENLYPAPRYFDLFSRYQHNERWDPHGDQAPKPHREAAE
jgi:N6-adenosine-specific RNA methylase IME4